MKLTITNKQTGATAESELLTAPMLRRAIAPFLTTDKNVINDLKIEVETNTTIKEITISGNKEVETEITIDLRNIEDDFNDDIIEEVEDEHIGAILDDWEYDDPNPTITINAKISKAVDADPENWFIKKHELEEDDYEDIYISIDYNKATYEVKSLTEDDYDDFVKWYKANEEEKLPEE